jgi:hypothetical protein
MTVPANKPNADALFQLTALENQDINSISAEVQ